MKKVLIVVDMQNDFITGSLGSPQAQLIIENVSNKISEYQKRNERIIFTRDSHQNNYLETHEGKNLPVEHCIIGTKGWEIYDKLDSNCKNCVYVDKPSFGWNGWKDNLGEDIEEIELVGLVTSICVISNALILKALYPEVRIKVDASCCAGLSDEDHRAALTVMRLCQIEIIN